MGSYYVHKSDKLLEVYPESGGQHRQLPFSVRLAIRHFSRLLPNVCDFMFDIDRGELVIFTDSAITDSIINIGERIFVGFYIPYNKAFIGEFEGEVTGFCTDKRDYPSGLHVRFINFSGEKLRKLEEFFALKGLNIDLFA